MNIISNSLALLMKMVHSQCNLGQPSVLSVWYLLLELPDSFSLLRKCLHRVLFLGVKLKTVSSVHH